MKLDIAIADPGVGSPDAALEQRAAPGALIHGLLAAASSVAASASRVLARHRLTVAEHALLSRLAAGATDCVHAAPGIALLSLQERGLVRQCGGTSRMGSSVEITGSGERLLGEADVALQQLETRMHARLAVLGPLAIQQILDDIAVAAAARDAAFT